MSGGAFDEFYPEKSLNEVKALIKDFNETVGKQYGYSISINRLQINEERPSYKVDVKKVKK